MNWSNLHVKIAWHRCRRRLWPPVAVLPFNAEEHRKTRHVLLYCRSGVGWRQTPDGRFPVLPGDTFWARPGGLYDAGQQPDHPLELTAIHFDLTDREGHPIERPPDALPPEKLTVLDPPLVDAVTTHIAAIALDTRTDAGPDEATAQAATLLLKGLLMQLDQDSRPQADAHTTTRWSEVTAFIHDHLHEAPTIAQIARHFGLSRSHFSREFKRRLGRDPRTFLIQARIALAQELLRETALPLNRIATKAGYGDPFQFSRQFRQLTHQTPRQYRQSFHQASPQKPPPRTP